MIRNFIVIGALATAFPAPAWVPMPQEATRTSVAEDDQTYVGEAPERYVQVRTLEGHATVRKGELTEELSLGVPLTEGDVIEARGRGVLQLGDGSRIVFGEGARFTLASLFSERDDVRQVLLRLDQGHLRVQVATLSQAIYRVDTPSGRATLQDRANASFEVDADRSVRVKVFTGRIRFANSQDRTQLGAGERLTVYSGQDRLDRIREFNTYELEAFDTWADRQFKVARGTSFDRLPASIRAYGEDLDRDGDWVEVEDIGWCWRPRGLEAEWRPYWRGRWGAYATGMTWISDEPWGYVTHHHGRWGWHARLGWYWIPGALYAPAWVAWRTVDAFFGWAPLGYWNGPCTWGYGHWNGGYCWNVVDFHHMHHHGLHSRIYGDVRFLRPFNTGVTAASGRVTGRMTAPWHQTPLIIRPNEWRDPQRIRAVVADVDQQRSRLTQVVREHPGRVILAREPAAVRDPRRVADPATVDRQPFHRHEPASTGRVPILREPSVLTDNSRGSRDVRPEREPRREPRTEIAPSRESRTEVAPNRGTVGEGRLRERPDGLRRAWEDGGSVRGREARPEGRPPESRREARPEEPRREMRSESPRRETRSEEPRREVRSEPPRREAPPARTEAPRSDPPRREAPPRSDPPKRDRS